MSLICRKSSILREIGVIGLELWTLDFSKNDLFCLVYTSIRKYVAIIMKLCHNVFGRKISDEFDYEHDRTSMSRVMDPWIRTNACFILLCLHSSTFISSPILIIFIQNVYNFNMSDDFDFEKNRSGRTRVRSPWSYKKMLYFALFTL